VEVHELTHPELPAKLSGLRILHLTDLHIRRGRPISPQIRKTIFALKRTPADLVLITGDSMHRRGDERAALQTLLALSEHWIAPMGAFGIFGNHDSVAFAKLVSQTPELPVTWLNNTSVDVGPQLRLIGASYPEDLYAAYTHPTSPTPTPRFNLGLVHYPTELFGAAELGIPIILAGHTHGGQFRLSRNLIPHTSCDLPGRLGTGVLRLRGSLCAISRGLGTALVQVRLNCPSQLPLYILKRGALPSSPNPDRIHKVVSW
jgi:predicted MPP superfamily phosphohydrolase